ncbi:L,D-transpeptidase family protein [Sphingomicrobium clamense]|uniref:L,D-transpeptidase family protein n=1 Tax=Sphingomicrobium clamense TaxID=2851013 RepID=A0ABS6V4W2_9SPHN|nr:L,D-transpeptidase family protein [Sphingomicrobium sp. B8]MBW0144597.1 L,D-transpeptidase family protein [Sphingomicrobium sp. B8]
MKQLAIVLAAGSLVLTTPVSASETNTENSESDVRSEFSVDASNLKRSYFFDGVEYDYSRAEVTLLGDISGGKNTLETYAARAEAAKQAEQGYRDMQERFGVHEIAPNKFKWNDEGAKGETRVVVSISRQLAFFYKGDTLVGAASVTTARDGKLTPQGIFPVWMKKDIHYSKAYDNTPMPYTQFLDEYGIALHAGPNPGYPASAGCIRLPKEFAKRIYAMNEIGTEVLIGA